jgi:hypothetical protein
MQEHPVPLGGTYHSNTIEPAAAWYFSSLYVVFTPVGRKNNIQAIKPVCLTGEKNIPSM